MNQVAPTQDASLADPSTAAPLVTPGVQGAELRTGVKVILAILAGSAVAYGLARWMEKRAEARATAAAADLLLEADSGPPTTLARLAEARSLANGEPCLLRILDGEPRLAWRGEWHSLEELRAALGARLA